MDHIEEICRGYITNVKKQPKKSTSLGIHYRVHAHIYYRVNAPHAAAHLMRVINAYTACISQTQHRIAY